MIMKKLKPVLLTTILFLSITAYGQKSRESVPEKYKWNLTDIYKSDDEWVKAKDAFAGRIGELEKYKGRLTASAADLYGYLELSSEIGKQAELLYSYASMSSDLDTRNMKYSGMKQEMQQIFSDMGSKMAFADPEILTADWKLIESYLKSEPRLEPYRMSLDNLFRLKKHTLSEPEERILALSQLVAGVPSSVYGTFSDAEMPSPEVVLSNGEKVTLTKSEYNRYRALPDRNDRKLVFSTFWNNWENYKATYGEILYGNVKSDMFNAKARNYSSSLEAALYPDNIPPVVYKNLVDNVNKNLPAFHRYLAIKKRMLGVDTLKYSDLYAPTVKGINLKYSFDEASAIIQEALKPLGDDYVATVKKAIENRWLDVYPTKGKQSGAYSNGLIKEIHPYILLNYTDLYSDMSTMAHELGHTMHSYFSNNAQPYPLTNYKTFVAEVASTFNEVLLFNYMIKKVKDDDTRLSMLMAWLDSFKSTLFRQTQFAEYELRIHEAVEKGIPMTGEKFSDLYLDILKTYYGHDKGVCFIDKNLEMEWALIPHFYMNFYVYQYSTSFTASISLAEKVMSGDKEALKKYREFLSSGASDYPIELLKKAGADMTTNDPFNKTVASMNKVMDEIEKILDKKGL